MSKFIIVGGKPLTGDVNLQGAKNGVLPILAATLLCKGTSVIHNCPNLLDVDVALRILRHLGCQVTREGNSVTVNAEGMSGYQIPSELMREMRSSIFFLGAIAARMGMAELCLPGGCELGDRPIDLHIKALRMMGYHIDEESECFLCTAKGKIEGCHIRLAIPSVGATENIMLTAVTARGKTIIGGAAREPEIVDLANFLNKCGARIRGAGSSAVIIDGVDYLEGAEHTVIPDRIAAVTYLAAAAATGGNICLRGVKPEHFGAVIPYFTECGCSLERTFDKGLQLQAPRRLQAPKNIISTEPYPGFPTDAQAPLMAMVSVAEGVSQFTENIFSSRYKHVPQLVKMGAKIQVNRRQATVNGVSALTGAKVEATDLRGGAALVIAGLSAQGVTEISNLTHIDRGYADLTATLNALGAEIKRV